MASSLRELMREDLAALDSELGAIRARSRHDDLSDILKETDVFRLRTRCVAAIERTAGRDSVYTRKAQSILESRGVSDYTGLVELLGVVQGLLHDVDAGLMISYEEALHGELLPRDE